MGRVFLVGAGPGDPGLITVRGAACLAAADLVLYDGLVNPLLLRLAKAPCERTARIRRGPMDCVVPQSAVNDRLVTEARAGRNVVRLKGGDPYIFGRGSEEAAALERAGVPFEVVPGITAATAAGEYAGFSFTHRDITSAVAFVTGHEDPSRESSRLDFRVLADFPGTLVFYMGLSRLGEICQLLVKNGRSPDTPAAVICHASLATQQVVKSTLSDLPAAAEAAGSQPPSLIVVGDCVQQRTGLNWFERLPLFGVSIGITRTDQQFDDIARQVVALGGEPVLMPLLSMRELEPHEQQSIESVFERLTGYRWLVFTSTNAVTEFQRYLWQSGRDARAFGNAQIAAVGSATSAALQRIGLYPDVEPAKPGADHLMDLLAERVAGKPVLWVRGRNVRETLRTRMRQCGAVLEELVVYNIQESTEWATDVEQRFRSAGVDWVALGSPAAARAFVTACSRFQLSRKNLPRLAVMSAETAEPLTVAGLQVSATAAKATWNDVLCAIQAAQRQVGLG
jgi:uroporphyrinogen III methyltransferase / synthase